jgi:uncharacterized repeat protein (TIGR02543 family)
MPSDPVREGFVFKGWSTSQEGTEVNFNSATIVTGAMSVYAVWELIVYKIKFIDGEGNTIDVEVPHGKTPGDLDDAIPEDPVREGYTFKGWNTEPDGSGLRFRSDTPKTGDEIYHAVWVQNSGAWIDGTVTEAETGEKLKDIVVKIMFHGSDNAGVDIVDTRTDDDGWFRFNDLPFGNYSLVFIDESRGIQVTRNIIIRTEGEYDGSAVMPAGSKNTFLHVEGRHTPNLSVANLSAMFDERDTAIAETGNLVTMTLHVEQIHIDQVDENRKPGDVDLIERHVRDEGEIVNALFLDMWLVRSTNGIEEIIQPRGGLIITIDLPQEFWGHDRVIHVHDGVVYVIEGRYEIIGNTHTLTFTADKFSTYALVITATNSESNEYTAIVAQNQSSGPQRGTTSTQTSTEDLESTETDTNDPVISQQSNAATTDTSTQTSEDIVSPRTERTGIRDIELGATPLFIDVSWSLINLLLSILTSLITLTLLTKWLMSKKRNNDAVDSKPRTAHSKLKTTLLSIIPAVAAIVLFILTQNINNPMVMVDTWTSWMAAIAAIQIVIALRALKKGKDQSDESKEKIFA